MVSSLDTQPAFSSLAFDLLRGIHAQPTVHYYHDHKADFREYVEQPLQRLMARVAVRLPAMAQSKLETRRNVFSRIPKNDFGRGSAWDNYWGAFYPKGSRRIMDAQLALWMDPWRLHASFYINDYGTAPRQRFVRNCMRFRDELPELLTSLLQDETILLAEEGRTVTDEAGRVIPQQAMTWDAWLDAPEHGDYWAFVPFTPAQVTIMPAQDLEDRIVHVFTEFFPLVLLASEEDPLPLMRAYSQG